MPTMNVVSEAPSHAVLAEKVNELARLRQALAEHRVATEKMQAELESTAQWQSVQVARSATRQLKEEVSRIEGAVRQEAVAIYDVTGGKHPHPQVQIKMFPKFLFSKEEAKGYCLEHMPSLLKLDVTRFKRVAKELDFSFVRITDEPRAYISKNLG